MTCIYIKRKRKNPVYSSSSHHTLLRTAQKGSEPYTWRPRPPPVFPGNSKSFKTSPDRTDTTKPRSYPSHRRVGPTSRPHQKVTVRVHYLVRAAPDPDPEPTGFPVRASRAAPDLTKLQNSPLPPLLFRFHFPPPEIHFFSPFIHPSPSLSLSLPLLRSKRRRGTPPPTSLSNSKP